MSTAKEAGWRLSKYNLTAKIPGADLMAVVNLYKGTCSACGPIEGMIIEELDRVDEHHPIVKRLADLGILVNFDEQAALESLGRISCGHTDRVSLTLCPTMACNFDCPYCFEKHGSGSMTEEVQSDILMLAERMLKDSNAQKLKITWYGGEPLLYPKIIEKLSGKLIGLAERLCVEYSARIITNGYLLTDEIAEMLGRMKVEQAQITLDGLGEIHDLTRHLKGGGPTFDRIVANLKEIELPFRVLIRHNIHRDNYSRAAGLKAFVNELALESGNRLEYYPALVAGNAASDERNERVDLLCDAEAAMTGIRESGAYFTVRRGYFCPAQTLYSAGVDECGNLYRCWEDVDKKEQSFGTAARWDPADPVATADRPDLLTAYLNTAVPVPDQECRDCVFLPSCCGGCVRRRFDGRRQCVPWKDEPEKYVLSLYERIGEKKKETCS
jgi:uncharacterized protein